MRMRPKNLTTAYLCPTWSLHLETRDTRVTAPRVNELNTSLSAFIAVSFSVLKFFFYSNVVQHDELREIFNDISSSSEDEDEEGERHEDEDLNIMDTEDDMVRQLHEKMNETDGSRDENDRNSQIGRMAVHLLSDQLLCIIRTAAQAQFKATFQYRRQADRQTNKSRPRLAFE